jgi:hypothetical protein
MIEKFDELLVSHLELVEAISVIKELIHGAILVFKKLCDGVTLVAKAGPKIVLPVQSIAHYFFQKC